MLPIYAKIYKKRKTALPHHSDKLNVLNDFSHISLFYLCSGSKRAIIPCLPLSKSASHSYSHLISYMRQAHKHIHKQKIIEIFQ